MEGQSRGNLRAAQIEHDNAQCLFPHSRRCARHLADRWLAASQIGAELRWSVNRSPVKPSDGRSKGRVWPEQRILQPRVRCSALLWVFLSARAGARSAAAAVLGSCRRGGGGAEAAEDGGEHREEQPSTTERGGEHAADGGESTQKAALEIHNHQRRRASNSPCRRL